MDFSVNWYMARSVNKPNTFLWVLRGLTSAFLFGYLVSIYFALFIYEWFPSENLAEDLLAVGLLLLMGLGYFLMWIRREGLSGILFVIWYAALWPAEILVGGDTFEDTPAPGIILLILGILLVAYSIGARRKHKGTPRRQV
jgi:hypothetical protein